MPVDFTGYWKMLANENFEEYLRALGKLLPRPAARGRGLGPAEPSRGPACLCLGQPPPRAPASERASAANLEGGGC